jgi:hypothetical protein
VYQAKTAAAKAKIKFCGENALPVRKLLAFTSTKVQTLTHKARL